MTRLPRAFTLVEILIVVAIVAVLLAFLFPVFNRAREKGRQASCQSNLKQLGLATAIYVQDYDSHYPRSVSYHLWTESIEPYVRDNNFFYCPSLSDHGLDSTYTYNMDRATTYNNNVYNRLNQSGVHESSIQRPSELVLLEDDYDSRYFPVELVSVTSSCPLTRHGYPIAGINVSTVHQGGSNSLFFDGHVKRLLPQKRAEMECQAGPYSPAIS